MSVAEPLITVTPRDVRHGETWTAGQRAKNFLIFVIVRICLFFVGISPRWLLRAGGRTLGRLTHTLLFHERNIATRNLARVFPDLDRPARDRLREESFFHLGEAIGDAAHAMTRGHFESLAIPKADACILQEALDHRCGVLLVSAHLGPWEQVAASLVAAGFPLTTIARESYDPRLTAIYGRLRERHGVQSIYRGEPGAMLRAMRLLRRGGVLGVVMDLKTRVASMSVPLLGNMAATAIGPARMALRSSARVVVATPAPNPRGGLQISVTPIQTADLSAGPEGERLLTERLNDEISRRIRALPNRWLWMHDRFAE